MATQHYEQLREELHDAVDRAEESIVELVDKAHEISLAGYDPTTMGAASGMRELVELISIGAEPPINSARPPRVTPESAPVAGMGLPNPS